MSYCDLLERMMQRDTAAFLEMTDRYGWSLYSEIRKRIPNKTEADRIYDETMQQFYRSLQKSNCEDPLEALLCGLADNISVKQGIHSNISANPGETNDLQPPPVRCPTGSDAYKIKTKKRKGLFWIRLCVFLLLVAFAAVIWLGLGLMMEAGIIPYFDLGYSWFSQIAAYWI